MTTQKLATVRYAANIVLTQLADDTVTYIEKKYPTIKVMPTSEREGSDIALSIGLWYTEEDVKPTYMVTTRVANDDERSMHDTLTKYTSTDNFAEARAMLPASIDAVVAKNTNGLILINTEIDEMETSTDTGFTSTWEFDD